LHFACVVFAATLLCLSPSAHGQFTANFQTNTVSGATSNWLGTFYIVGSNTFSDVLQITGSGVLSNSSGALGYAIGSSNNTAVVSGTGSTWRNATNLYVGFLGTGNRLIITNGGRAIDIAGTIGYTNAGGDMAVISGAGSVWSNTSFFYVGYSGSGGQLILTNGGSVWSGAGYVGVNSFGSNNVASIIGTGSVWTATNALYVGDFGSSNTLTITGGGAAKAPGAYLGVDTFSSNNTVLVVGAGSIFSNTFDFFLGSGGAGNQLVVSNGAFAGDAAGFIGFTNSSSGNSALISGTGSIWTNGQNLYVGYLGSSNQMVAANGGKVFSGAGYVGWFNTTSNNTASVTGTGSVWSATNDIYVGYIGSSNQLTIANGGGVSALESRIGYDPFSTNNVALVTGSGSTWSNQVGTIVGLGGVASQLIISNGAIVFDTIGELGDTNQSSGNTATVTGGGSTWINTNVLYVGNLAEGNTLFLINGGVANSPSTYLGVGPTSSNNTVIVSGAGSVLSNAFNTYLGFQGSGNLLVISNNATVFDETGVIAYTNASSRNAAWIIGPGAVWSNSFFVSVGYNGTLNQLVITNGGTVFSGNGFMADSPSSSNNMATITGGGSVWSTTNGLYVGYVGSSNQLFIGNGGAAFSLSSFAGAVVTSSNNTIIVSDPGSVMSNTFNTYIGDLGPGNLLVVSNGATVVDEEGIVGHQNSSGHNTVLVDGTGSIWSNTEYVYVGYDGATNQMKVTNGGAVIDGTGVIGDTNSSPGNVIVVSGAGSTWINTSNLFMGYFGSMNQLIVTNGGAVYGANSYIGTYPPSSNNTIIVTGPGSVWITTTNFDLGDEGSGNALMIKDGGVVITPAAAMGNLLGSSNNTALVTGIGSVWSNTVGGIGVGGSGGGNSLTISNGGIVFGLGEIGGSATSSNNSLIVTGTGSTWTDTFPFGFSVGFQSRSNLMQITSGGAVFDGYGVVGSENGSNNLAVVAGPGSVWNNTTQFIVGSDSFDCRLVVSNGGAVFGGSLDSYLGQLDSSGANSNSALVAGSGSIWSNRANLYIGYGSYGTTLVISNGGVVFNSNAWLGYQIVANDDSNNIAVVTGTGSIWNNTGTLTIGQGGNNNVFVSNQLFVTSGGRVIAPVVDVGSPGSLGNVLRLSNGVVQATSVNVGSFNYLTGSGTITGNTVNFGTISANVNGGTLTFANGVKNQGFIGTSGGGIFEVYGLFYNVGTTSFTTNSAIFHGPVLSAQGTTNSWKVAGSGLWEQAADWSQGVTPSTTNAAVLITNATSKTVTITASTFTAAPGSVTNFGITVSGPSGSTNTLVVENTPVGSPFVAVQLDVGTNASAVVTNGTLQVGVEGSGTLTVDGQMQVGPGGLLDTSNGGTMNVGSVSSAAVSITGGGTALSAGVVMGAGFLGSTAVVSGAGSVWSNGALVVQSGTLIITNGGAVVGSGEVGGDGGFDVLGIVTGPGSVWTAEGLYVGYVEAENNQLIITNGGAVHVTGSSAAVDDFSGANNQLTVSGNGALFDAAPADLYIGFDGFDNDRVNIGPGGTVLAGYVSLGEQASTTTNFINMTGGSLFVTNVYGSAQFQVYGGALVLNGGTVTVNDLVLETNLGVVAFSAGTLYSASTQATNGVPFVVGDGVDAAGFQLEGGVHSFTHLEIRNAALLSGCGTVTGPVVVDAGGTMLSDCGTLTFTGIVTNNGTMRATGGSVLETYSNLVNNGTIDIIDGSTNFHGVFINHGTIVTTNSVRISAVSISGNDVDVQIHSSQGHTYQLQETPSLTPTNWTDTAASQGGTGSVLTFTDTGGATNVPGNFYRIDCSTP
jgi:T5SS/PEP-CTERM-associated repeat protein